MAGHKPVDLENRWTRVHHPLGNGPTPDTIDIEFTYNTDFSYSF